MKRRKVGKGKSSNLQFFREKMMEFIENWELDDLIGGSVYHKGSAYWTNELTSKFDSGEIVKKILEKNESEKFRKILFEKKKEIDIESKHLYRTYLSSDDIPTFKDRVYHLVHYFYHGSIPLDKTLKSASTLRKEEKEVINIYGREMMTDLVEVDLGDDLPSIPRDMFWEILKFIPHDYDHLCRIGLVNEKFFISFLLTWEHLSILSPKRLKQVSLLVLKNCREISFCHDPSEDEDDEEKSTSKGSRKHDLLYSVGNLKYLYKNITASRIVTLDLSECEQATSYFNIIKSMFQEKMVFPNLKNLVFMYVPFRTSYADDDDPTYDFFEEGPYHIKRTIHSFSYKTGEHNFCPNLRKVKNASVESLMIIPRTQYERLESIRLFLYKKDANVLNECGFEFPSCETFEIHPREVLKSSYVERVFEKIEFSSTHLRKLGVSVSSNEDVIVFNHEAQSKLEHLELDFSANFAKPTTTQRNWFWGGSNKSYHVVESPKKISLGEYDDDRLKKSLQKLTISYYPIKTDKRKPKFMTSLIKQFKASKSSSVEEVELKYWDYERGREHIDYWDEFDDEERSSWDCPFFREVTTFNKYYLKDLVSKFQVFTYRYITVKCHVVSQMIEVAMKKGREIVVTKDILYLLSALSQCVKSKSGSLKEYKSIRIIYEAHPFCPFEQRKSLRRFLEEYFSFCDISIEYEDARLVSHIAAKKKKRIKRKKKKKKEEEEEDSKPLKECKICISHRKPRKERDS